MVNSANNSNPLVETYNYVHELIARAEAIEENINPMTSNYMKLLKLKQLLSQLKILGSTYNLSNEFMVETFVILIVTSIHPIQYEWLTELESLSNSKMSDFQLPETYTKETEKLLAGQLNKIIMTFTSEIVYL